MSAATFFSRADVNQATRIAAEFSRFLTQASARGVLLWTPPNKGEILTQLRRELTGWVELPVTGRFESPFKGRLDRCLAVAKQAFQTAQLSLDERWDRQFNWGGRESRATVLFLTNPTAQV